MNRIFRITLILTLFSYGLDVQAQLPPRQPEQDCFGALSICQDIYFQADSYRGAGRDPDEIDGNASCMILGERNSVWYKFRIQTGGQLCFTISPVDSADDYDWALYNITNSSCAAIPANPALEVACNWTFNNGCAGETGPNGRTDCAGQFEPCLTVNAGDSFVLNVSNFTSSNAGYTINFSQSTAVLFDDTPPNVTGSSSFCTGVTITFDENILCNTVDPTDFAFSGPDGPYTISEVISANCDTAGGGFSNSFDLVVSPPIQQAGNYTISLVGFVGDFCNNGAAPYTANIFMPLPPNAGINAQNDQCLLGNSFGFDYTGPSQARSILWNFGDGISSTLRQPVYSYAQAGNYFVEQIITDVNGCNDTALLAVNVLEKPDVSFSIPNTACQNESIDIINQTSYPGSSFSSLSWRTGDGLIQNNIDSLNYAYTRPGRYQVFLEAFNALGCRDTASRFLEVYPKALVDFQVEENVCNGDSAHFVFLGSMPQLAGNNDQIASWWWSTGDGDSLGALRNPAHLYDSGGVYPVTLFIETDKGCVDSLRLDQEIFQPEAPSIDDTPVCFGEQSLLTAVPDAGGISRWYYNMTDEDPFQLSASFFTPPVTFPQPYYVDQLSKEGCVSERILVEATHHPVWEGEIIPSDTVVEFPTTIVNFNLGGNLPGDLYNWDFGDGNTAMTTAPAHEYKYPDKFMVKLNVKDIYGCPYEYEQLIEVKNLSPVHVPSAFSPNDDGINDEWFIATRLLQRFRVTIYNRFGNEIYRSEDTGFRWNGRNAEGQALREGVYVYRVQAVDNLGNSIDKTGTVTLYK
ncbi:MAG: PKD domain-containing protein [Bacteroidota bacterium]